MGSLVGKCAEGVATVPKNEQLIPIEQLRGI